jgi:rhodanese-related sulfurtransferase
MTKSHIINGLLIFIIGLLVTASVIYLSPLKHIAVIEPTIDDITAEEFYSMYEANPDKYIFLDVRNSTAYNRLHAAGSELQPLHTLYTERAFLPKNTDKEIVLICSGGVASGVGFSYLEHYGFFNVKRVAGGIEAWEAAGLPVETNTSG